MLTYITLGLVVLKYVLDYVAPKTKTKVDDKVRDEMAKLPLPSLPTAAAEAAKEAGIKMEKPSAAPVVGFGPGQTARDHRTK